MTEGPVLDPEEVAALQEAIADGGGEADVWERLPPLAQPDPDRVQPFALASAAAGDPARFPAFLNLHDRLGEALRERCSEVFGRECQLARRDTRRFTYREALGDETPMLWMALEEAALGRFYARMELGLALAAVDAMLGGPGELEGEPPAHLTPLELRLARHLADDLAGIVAEAWRPVRRLQVRVLRVDHDPQFLGVAAPEATCHAVVFAAAPERSPEGTIEIGYPDEFVRGVLEALDQAHREEERAAPDARWQARLEAALAGVPATLALELGRARISIGAFLHLRAGDELTLDVRAGDAALLRVRRAPFAQARIRDDGGRLRAEILATTGGSHD